MSRHQKYFRPEYSEPENQEADPIRMFIRRNRKKILIFLVVGIILLLALIVAAGIFLFNAVIPVGMEATNQLVESGQTQSTFIGVKNWITEFMKNFDLSQLLSLLLLAN